LAHFVKDTVTLTAETSGTTGVTDYSKQFNGEIWAVGYYAAATHFLTTSTLTLSVEDSSYVFLNGVAVSTSLHWYYPRANVHTTTGANVHYTTHAATGEEVGIPFPVSNERVKAVIGLTSGTSGANQSGTLMVIVKGSMP